MSLKNFSIKVKMLIISVVAFLSLSSIISFISIKETQDIVLKNKLEQLKAINVAKYSEIKNYLQNIKGLLTSLSQDSGTKEAFHNLNKTFYKLDKELSLDKDIIKNELKIDLQTNYLPLVNYKIPNSFPKKDVNKYLPNNISSIFAQYIFITKNKYPIGKKNLLNYDYRFNTSYMKAHKKFHTQFDNFLKTFGLYDIFLVNLKGDVIYTDFKEKDFATNLYNGPYKETGLAKAFKKSLNLNKNDIAFEDYRPYEPSYNKPASFIATPIFSKGKIVGSLIFQMPVDKINNIMKFDGLYIDAGLGKSGDCFLVGSDYKMRTNSRFYDKINNSIVKQFKTTIGIIEVKTKSTFDVFQKNKDSGFTINKNYKDIEVLSAYHVLNLFNQTKWVLISEINKNEVLEKVTLLKYKMISISIILFILSIIIYIIFIQKLIIKPLNKFQKELLHFFEFLNGKRDDVKLFKIDADDEIGNIAKFVNKSILTTKETFKQKDEENWIKDKIRELNNNLVKVYSEKEIANLSLQYICNQIEASVGVFYIYNEDEKKLKFLSSYALIKKSSFKYSYALGEGFIGEVGIQKSSKILSNINHISIESAIISTTPTNTYIFSLTFQDNLIAVIEIGKLKNFKDIEIDFLNEVKKNISAILFSTIKNTKVKILLEKSQQANKKLKNQQDILETVNAQMEEQQIQLENANAQMEEQQQQLEEVNVNLSEQKHELENSQQKLQEQFKNLEKANKEIELASKYKSEFLANMSHELRTPLNSIILLSQLLVKNSTNNLSDDEIKKANTIYKSGNELLRLINDILDLSKIESKKVDVILDQFHSKDLITEIEDLFKESINYKNLEFNIVDNYNDFIFSDKNKISQILRNLISNSLKFTSHGFIKLTIEKDKNDINFIVQDTGIGIDEDKLEKIFEAFIQADGTTNRKYGGTGLGLSISKELTTLLNGKISVKSEVGKGSEFIVKIPNLQQKYKKPKIIKDDRDKIKEQLSLLVINNDEALSKTLYQNIKEHNKYTLIASNAKDGLELLNQYNILGIVINLDLPDINGIELIKKIKNNTLFKNTPIHIVTKTQDTNEMLKEFENFLKEIEHQDKVDNIDLSDINVLVVDDDIKNIFVLDSALEEYHAKTINAFNGKEALEKLQDNKIDIILLDIMMPIMDGYETIDKIRNSLNLNIPIIVTTAKTMQEEKEKAISLGANDFISKPINIETLIKLVKVWSEKNI